MNTLLQEFRFALRFLRRRPLFVAVAVGSLAIGLGVNTAIFSVVNALLIRSPAGIPDPGRVVEIGRTDGGRGFDTFSYPELLAMREEATPLAEVAGWSWYPLSLSTGGSGERISGLVASHNYFDVMGIRPYLGRFIAADEDAVPGTGTVVVMSYRFWRDRFGSDPGVIGTDVDINRRAFTVVGVAPEAWRGHIFGLDPDVYIPLTMRTVAQPGPLEFDNIRWSWFTAVGRLAPGATVEQADAAVAAVIGRLADQTVDERFRRGATAIPIGLVPGAGRGGIAAFFGLILGAVGLVLLITCANVAGMLIARALSREREIAIRLAIGAGRLRLVRQLMAESLLLFGLGGVGGVLLAWWATGLLNSVRLPIPIRLEFDFSPDIRVLGAGMAVALVTGIIFGLAPALQATNPGLVGALKNEAASGRSRAGLLRRVFVSAQVALSLVLLVAAGLFLRSLEEAASINSGFDAANVDLVAFDLSIDGYDEARGGIFINELLDRMRERPRVRSAAVAIDLPLDLASHGSPVYPEGYEPTDGATRVGGSFNVVSEGYFETLDIEIRRGRGFAATDRDGATPVVIVSRTFAERAWPDLDPIGRRVRNDEAAPWLTVVGVADDVKNQLLSEETEPMIYYPIRQRYDPGMMLVVRGDPASGRMATEMLETIREVDPALSVDLPQSLEAYTAVGILPQRLGAIVTTALGLMALLLSAIGVYGVIAYMVAQRKREIGVRIAFGARARDVVSLILRGALGIAVPGLVIGLVLAFGFGLLLRGFILGVAPVDPVTFIMMPAILLAAVVIASVGPARKASAVEPLEALRAE
jgi:predicted permease